jgi:GntR family transcriptional regulator
MAMPATVPAVRTIANAKPNHRKRRRLSRRFASLKRSSNAKSLVNSSGRVVVFGGDGLSVTVFIEATIIVFMSSFKSGARRTDEDSLALNPLDRSDPTLLHEQVAGAIRRAIAEGEASPGERIPQAKDLAAELGVNTNTVLRALRVLRDEGVIEMGRGRSIRVTGRPDRGVVAMKMKELLEVARQHGYRKEDLVLMLEKLPGR